MRPCSRTPASGGTSAYWRLLGFLRAHRVRPHLFSGIEFQMGVFIVAPLAGMFSVVAMLAFIAGSAVLMLAFEALLVYKLWRHTRRFERVDSDIRALLP
ncbi:hypothetical protein [Nocardiopsis sp. LOL_012]|uniref:hypothetical protein n=1 Tax=Nocardiopsis sp. LOL_012 TaxID=3345409 RepID=UPI003A85BA74